MRDDTQPITRRRFLRWSITGLAGISVLRVTNALSDEELPKLNENDPVAQPLGYVRDATKADIITFPKREGDAGAMQFCQTCQFYLGDKGSAWGGCVVFSDYLVNAGGWCSSWVEKMGA